MTTQIQTPTTSLTDLNRAARLLVEIASGRARPYLAVRDLDDDQMLGLVAAIAELEAAAASTREGLDEMTEYDDDDWGDDALREEIQEKVLDVPRDVVDTSGSDPKVAELYKANREQPVTIPFAGVVIENADGEIIGMEAPMTLTAPLGRVNIPDKTITEERENDDQDFDDEDDHPREPWTSAGTPPEAPGSPVDAPVGLPV